MATISRPTAEPPNHGWLDVLTSDVDDAACIQRQWMQMQYDQLDRGSFAGRFRMLRTAQSLVVAEMQNRTVLKQQHSPPGYCTISLVRRVAGRGRCGLDTLSGQSIGFMPGARDYEVQLPPSEILYFGFDESRLVRAADVMGHTLPGHGKRPIFLDGLDAASLTNMADTLLWLPNNLGNDAAANVNRAYLDDAVLARALDILVHTPSDGTRLHALGAQRITQRARALIDDSPHEPWTVLTLCEALHVSRPTLQRAFLQMYDMSPLAWLRIRRLNGARRALQAGRGSTATVSAIAMHWGFFHLSRFAKDYQKLFGELPSKTLGHR
ncbi:helix-turn-helix domain-containing protein [Cupriavidus pauculus]|uniref:HTH araC/xylS-type domain-containing protein n=1 Tax=Cupriavidus pauculus TaxID=82633 RepID=A0A2N5CB12_9BURK|nr:helix-turn-helix domain-containing protein [Cupriavidus pauculus]PLP99420.1 hypothetical protein CYJ10_16450 [Cupriavidus pauculus]